MVNVSIVYSKEEQIEKVKELGNNSLTFNFINICTKKGKKNGWSLKNYWGARLDPFALVTKDDKPIKVFYSEATDVINDLNIYLHGKID